MTASLNKIASSATESKLTEQVAEFFNTFEVIKK